MVDEATERQPARGLPIRELLVEVIEGPQAATRASAEQSLTIGTAEGNDLRLADRTVSRYHLELGLRESGIAVRDLGSTNGTFVGSLRLVEAVVPPGTVVRLGATAVRVSEGQERELPLHRSEALAGLRGRSPAMRTLMAQIAKASESDVGVLLSGESGTGKELAARALHELGRRSDGPFIIVDCGALAPTLVASELFGHEKGAFTGADERRIGAFEQAQRGTVFLDEVGELPSALQASLLGVLERRKIKRLGGRDEIAIDVRVVSATHRDLRADVNEDRFRLDLYYRLAVVTLRMPPLRDRLDDLPLLIEHFLRDAGIEDPIEARVSERAVQLLRAHRWPGNVRELRNWVDAAIAMGDEPELLVEAQRSDGADPIGALIDRNYADARGALLAHFEERYLRRLLERAGGNVSQAARIAEMNRSHLNDLLRRHSLR